MRVFTFAEESGWDPMMDTTPRVPVHGPFYNAMKHIVAELIKDASSWPFLHPVDIEAVTDYYSYIKDPMGTLFNHGQVSWI